MSFQSLGLMAELSHAVSDKGYSAPTPIQKQAIPLILEGRDLMGGAQTGTGKTAGFTLPLLQNLIRNVETKAKKRKVRALILVPTRELVNQVAENVRAYGMKLPLRTAAVYGGVSINPQISKLRKGVDIVVATPGRLLDHVRQSTIDLANIEILVLDEADRMLDMGFIHDIRKILAILPNHKQTLMFSATFSNEVKRLSKSLLKSLALVEVAQRNTVAKNVNQIVHPVDASRKRKLLSFLIGSKNWKQVLVFVRTKRGADRLAEQLNKDGLNTAAIHGNKKQGARTKTLANFKSGKTRVLVATDIAARGLDISHLPHVVNYDLPSVAEDYIHRIGRTGRAGMEGDALSLVSVDEMNLLDAIERLIKCKIKQVMVEGYEPDPSITRQVKIKSRGRKNVSSNKLPRRKAVYA